MRVGLDAWRDAHVDRLLDAQLTGDLGDALEFDATVDDDAADTRLDGFAQLARRLVVAMHEHALGRKIHCTRDSQLATARYVKAQALVGHHASRFFIEKRLAGIHDIGILIAAAERLAVGLHAAAHVRFVHDVQSRALLARQLHHVDAAYVQVVVAHFGGTRQHRAQLHGGTVVGLLAQIGCGQSHRSAYLSACLLPLMSPTCPSAEPARRRLL